MPTNFNDFLAGAVDVRNISIPSGLGWPSTYGSAITLRRDGSNGFTGTINYDPFAGSEYAACIANRIYVATNGNDTTGNGTIGTPYATIEKAIAIGNAGSGPYSVWVKGAIGGAVYARTYGGQITVAPTKDCAFVAYGGTVIMGAFDDLAWSQNTTTHPELVGYPNVWAVARSSFGRALALSVHDEFGQPYSLKKVTASTDAAGIAKVNDLPGSTYNSASKAYLSMPDLSDPNLTRVRGLLTTRAISATTISTPVNLFFTGETSADAFEIWGGIYVGSTTPFASQKILAFRRVSSVGATSAGGRAFSVESWNGIAYFERCASISPDADGFNIHDFYGAANSYAILVNCSGVNAGQIGQVSCQNVTAHEDCKVLVIGGTFTDSNGGNVRNINTSKMFIAGATFARDRGDFANGVLPVEIRADDTAVIWLDTCVLQPVTATAYAMLTTSSAYIYYRGLSLNGKLAYGNVATY